MTVENLLWEGGGERGESFIKKQESSEEIAAHHTPASKPSAL